MVEDRGTRKLHFPYISSHLCVFLPAHLKCISKLNKRQEVKKGDGVKAS